MRFLIAAIAALSVSGVSAIQCVVKSTSAGATACTTVDSVSTEIIGGSAVSIDIPKFDTVANGGAILDAVWINWIDADYNPTVTYRSTVADTNSFTVSVSIADTWTLFSAVDNKPFTRPVLDATANQGGMSVDPTQAGFTDGANPCVKQTDAFTHTTNCLDGGILSADFKMTDTTFASTTLTVASGIHSFNPDFTAGQTYINFEGPAVNTATSGVRVTTTTPNAGYSTAGAGGNWQITTSTGATPTTPANVAGSFTVNGGSGGTVTVQVTHSLKLQFEIQYDYHLPSVGGDPQFAGFQGQNFQVHGAPDSYFALISAPNYYVNARFDYLSTGSCTYNETQCFTHPGTYMGLVYVGMKDANVLIQAGAHATGFAGVLVNDKQLSIGDRVNLPASPNSYIQMLSKSKLVLALDNVVVNVVNSDHFVNFDLSLTDKQLLTTGSAYHVMPNGATPSQIAHKLNKWYGSFNPLHGLIGQTWRNVKYADNKLYQGDITEYQLDKIVDHTFLYCVYEP